MYFRVYVDLKRHSVQDLEGGSEASMHPQNISAGAPGTLWASCPPRATPAAPSASLTPESELVWLCDRHQLLLQLSSKLDT